MAKETTTVDAPAPVSTATATAVPDSKPARVSIQRAFAATKAEASVPTERAEAPAKTSTESVTSDSPANEASAIEPSTETAIAESSDSASDLMSEAELSALKAKHPNDPDAIARELKTRFTQKTQELATMRNALTPWADFIEKLEKGDTSALVGVAKHFGLEVSNPAAQAKTEAVVKSSADLFKQSLGPDLNFLADGLGPAIESVVQHVVRETLAREVGPLKQQVESFTNKLATDESNRSFDAFAKAHPDWQQHEPAMMTLSSKIKPVGMTPNEFASLLYDTVTRDVQIAEATKKTIARMQQAAREDGERTSSVSVDRVTETLPPGTRKMKDLWHASKRELSAKG
jgi:hypothetical protein